MYALPPCEGPVESNSNFIQSPLAILRNVKKIIFLFRTTTRPTTTTQSNFDLNSNSGKWLPDPDLEECGYDLSTGHIIGKSNF